MEYNRLGNTNLKVSKLCFGALTIGPLQACLPIPQGAAVIRRALELGVNFIDTAELYETYPYIREALRGFSGEVVVASKSYAYTAEGMQESLEKARRELDRDVVDIFLLHEQESALTLQGHRPALEYLLEAKVKDLVRAVGISTHAVAAVRAAGEMPEIEVIHPLINLAGIGILDGTKEEMLEAIRLAHQKGKGIYGMKPIGGGNLMARAGEALRYALSLPELHAVAVGMKSNLEVEVNVALAEGRQPDPLAEIALSKQKRRLHIDDWCQGCGRCVDSCPQNALSLFDVSLPSQLTQLEEQMVARKVRVNVDKCLLCGYCGASCPEFCIKIV
ncbi:MAG: 4Fe-4S dicluster domain-containing protein [Syntrophomonadaceae bacterium]|nr:4Fe-4S dicluster domain-containing protein [Syntrophomonadaceae bacterium]